MAPCWVCTPLLGGYDQAASELSSTNIRTIDQKFLERTQSVDRTLCKTSDETFEPYYFFLLRPLTLP